MADISRRGSAQWSGDLMKGAGTVSTESGTIQNAQYSFKTRFENGTGTNPEGSGAPVGGWGSSPPYLGASLERKASASSTSTTMSGSESAAGNGRDSHDNAADWVTRALREPQNTTSTPEP